jgi:hypothetical protein
MHMEAGEWRRTATTWNSLTRQCKSGKKHKSYVRDLVGLPAEMIKEVAADIGKYRERLLKCLCDDNQLVVAHALLVLKRANDPMLTELPKELLNRHGKITLRIGSFSETMELGAFARMLKKEAATGVRV